MSILFSSKSQVRLGLNEQKVANVLQEELDLLVRNSALEAFVLLLQHNGHLTVRKIDKMGRRDAKDEFMGSLKYLKLVCRTTDGFEITDKALACFEDMDILDL